MTDKSKPDRHIFYCAVHLFLLKDNQILLLKRRNTGYRDGYYSVPAGHVDQGESTTDAMIREAKDETGVTIKSSDLRFIHVMQPNKTDAGRIHLFFTASEWQGEIKNTELYKCEELKWFPIDKLPQNTIPYIKSAIEHYLKGNDFSEFEWK